MHGTVPEDIFHKLNQEEDPEVLKQWLFEAAQMKSFEDFREKISAIDIADQTD